MTHDFKIRSLKPSLLVLLMVVPTALFSSCAGKAPQPRDPSAEVPHSPGNEKVTLLLKNRMITTPTAFKGTVTLEKIRARSGIPRFYQQRLYTPAWVNDEGPLPRVRSLLQTIRSSEHDGLNPTTFHLATLQLLVEDIERRRYLQLPIEPLRLSELDLLLTDAFLTLCNQFQTGTIAAKQAGFEWHLPPDEIKDPVKILSDAVESDRVAESLREALPQTQEYKRLRAALSEYRKIAKTGGWKLIPPGRAVRPGGQDRRIPLLRKHLFLSHDLNESLAGGLPSPKNKKLLDDSLVSALKHFQARHGIPSTGILDKPSLAALNVSAQKRVRQILLNLERLRWVSHDFGSRYIIVNIAEFGLQAIEHGHTALQMPVIVGSLYKQTPVFTGIMSHVVMNPYWFVPKSIIIESMLDKIKADPGYLAKNHFTVLRKTLNKTWQVVDPAEVDWKNLSDEDFDLNLRRNPGPTNPLGQVKFIFPNPFSVYLHDTPEKELFKKGVRTLSSGCIRVAKPLDLLNFVLQNNPTGNTGATGATGMAEQNSEWTEQRIREQLESQEEHEVPLKAPIPVHMLYQTAWADENGTVQFRSDIYGRDELLDQLLN